MHEEVVDLLHNKVSKLQGALQIEEIPISRSLDRAIKALNRCPQCLPSPRA